jgi:cold shock CspA family protein
MQGVVKLYDPVTGTGVVLTETDQQEVYLRPGSLEGSLFRLLRQGQRILFDTVEEEGNTFVVGVHLGTEHS